MLTALGAAFLFDRSTASVRLDPATGRGIINYQGTWTGNGQRYDVTMTTPPAGSAPPTPAAGARPPLPPVGAGSNTLEQLTVVARRMPPRNSQRPNGTGSFASAGSVDAPIDAAAADAIRLRAAATAAFARFGPPSAFAPTPAPAARPPPRSPSPPPPSHSSGGAAVEEGPLYDMQDPGNQVVGEGLRRFFSSLIINLQGIELRQPTLLVQLPGAGTSSSAGAAGARFGAPAPRPAHSTAAAVASSTGAALLPALLTISMKVAILQLPPMNMKF
ncbi:hypothetical protein TSOC_011729 [Tetrabaena socialis]|uniref:Uncharacterized protein n=1 Tax=Tetrabaena socialis TaxID=47790 RepID=A0A2J7ZPW0_9CHLO|nr:hypothetical protein TSOC_011729 [Tetrabaena socialis]|eukprot:PNH02300.1 hypothetical protein TSOC_011729 [Tetrabaena socialis]